MAKKRKYRTVSMPTGITDEIEELIEELGYWPSVGAFVREATLKMLREEKKRPREPRKAERREPEAGEGG